ncbi:DUF983 domain-containing protein [Flavobacterium sp. SUN052]|uniref:DUF983 domain-containing protein n=1 Tax=Flavobacterium sp. SUN052 TaxID=3002441 RepID=UPI00237D729E|nr:DUF983 domain-containing protein [Flavobacterium sp. SUN052]MEC4005710.1 DUF983 domain-containing protein [Flavobacterium sp. SUN052]
MISLVHILKNECPNCNKGKVFSDNFFFSLGFPKMNKHCSNCNFKFEKEPGYFFGAMFVNYAITVGEALITFFISSLFFEKTFDFRVLYIIGFVILLLASFNIRLSRMIWIYAFKNYSR